MKFSTAEEFYNWCKERRACEEGLEGIDGLTVSEWWDKTNRGDWMNWLWGKRVWDFTDSQRKEHNAKLKPIDDEHNAKLKPIDDEHNAKRKPIDDEHNAKRKPIDDEHNAKLKPIYDEYSAKLKPIYDEYYAKRKPINDEYHAKLTLIDDEYNANVANLIRSIVGNPFE